MSNNCYFAGDSFLDVQIAAFVRDTGIRRLFMGPEWTRYQEHGELFLSLTFHMIHIDEGDVHTMPPRGHPRPKTTPMSTPLLFHGVNKPAVISESRL